MKSRILVAGACAGLVSLAGAAQADAATVNLRVEGPTKTVFEGQVSTGVGQFKFSNEPDGHQCDGTGQYGSTTAPAATRGAALTVAQQQTGFSMTGSWSATYNSPTIMEIGGENVDPNNPSGKYLAEYKNGKSTDFGMCGDAIKDGDSVVFGYADFTNQTVLKLAGPVTAKPGDRVTVKVSDEASGAPVSGAAIAGQTTASDGTATVTVTTRGAQAAKAEKADVVRSNALPTCVTDGADGFCGTAAPGAPAPSVAPCATNGHDGLCGSPDKQATYGFVTSVKEGARLARSKAPRTLSGRVDADPSGLKDVRLRLTRTDNGHCFRFDGATERFRPTSACGASKAKYFSIGAKADWSYLLPAKLPRGRYVLDVRTVDAAGNADTKLDRGRNRVVFHVA